MATFTCSDFFWSKTRAGLLDALGLELSTLWRVLAVREMSSV